MEPQLLQSQLKIVLLPVHKSSEESTNSDSLEKVIYFIIFNQSPNQNLLQQDKQIPSKIESEISSSQTEIKSKEIESETKEEETLKREESVKKKMEVNDFQILSYLGEGAYAKVVLVRHLKSEKTYAMKIIEKRHMTREKKEHEVRTEREVLTQVSHPGIIRLHFSFMDGRRLYFILQNAANGELQTLLNREHTLSPLLAQFYAAEIVSMLQYLHSKGIAHRDLKPQNLLINHDWHLLLVTQ